MQQLALQLQPNNEEINRDIRSKCRREPYHDTQGYLLVLARTVVTFANEIHGSHSFVCVVSPSRDSRMPYGIKLPHYQRFIWYAGSYLVGGFVHHLLFAWSCGHQKSGIDKRRLGSVGLASRVNLSAKVGSGGARLGEVAREDGLEEGTEDDLGTTVEGQSKSVFSS
jgi:hypothetical protein